MKKKKRKQRKLQRKARTNLNPEIDKTQSLKTKEDMIIEMKEDKSIAEKNRAMINTTGKD